ncbi:two-component sensor histidine kinase BarA [Arsukibacterium sp.]|uniref:two-component sensor histidine kinase BarA n=1 Tax=Arsukibacterium sp. TaxID=1977258 RepID=UPI002FD98378
MTKIGLRFWILLCSVLPMLLASLLLGSYFSYVRHQDLQHYLHEQASNIALPLAISSSALLQPEQQAALRQLLNTSHRLNSPMVRSISLFDANDQLLLSSNPQYDLQIHSARKPLPLPPSGHIVSFDDSLLFYQPLPGKDENTAQPYLLLQLQTDKLLLAQQLNLFYSVLLILAVVLIGLLLSLLLMQQLFTPLRRMLGQLLQLQKGEYQTQQSSGNIAELQQLQSGINSLSNQLVQAEAELQHNIEQLTSDLQLSMEQLEVQNIQLDFARRKAVEENRHKSEFLAKMSHELRTPLNGVIGFTRQLLKTQLSSNQHDYLSTIQKSANSLLHLVNDVLDFSRLEEGRMSINPQPFSLRDLLYDATELLAANAFDKQLELVMNIEAECPDDLIADPARLTQILMNIAGNAIKFTEHGSIVIRVSATLLNEDQLMLHCSVQDTGRGISEDTQRSLFQGFTSSNNPDRQTGSGLGLMISQRLVQAMGGNIGFESKPAEGSTFWFTIKCQRYHLSVAEPLTTAPLENKTILYFEPQQHSREATLSLLNSWGLHITACATKGQLQQAINHQQRYDIGLIGRAVAINQVNQVLGLIEQIKPSCQHTYLLVNTLSPNLREAMLASGADACLPKPVHQRKLAMTMARPYMQYEQLPVIADTPPQVSLRVLSVDDNDANLKLINTLLNEMVEHVDTATDGAEAWQKATQHVYDIIFMDINMPVMDGVTACQRIRESSLNEHTPIIAVTAHAVEGERERLLSLGFSEFLSKPLDEKMLHYSLQEFCPASKWPSKPKAELPSLQQHPLIDWPLALQRAGGKTSLANDMLFMLINSLPEAQQLIQRAIDANDAPALLQHIHKVHGACCYTGVPRLKSLAETLETQLKNQCLLSDIAPELSELDDLLVLLQQLAPPAES